MAILCLEVLEDLQRLCRVFLCDLPVLFCWAGQGRWGSKGEFGLGLGLGLQLWLRLGLRFGLAFGLGFGLGFGFGFGLGLVLVIPW